MTPRGGNLRGVRGEKAKERVGHDSFEFQGKLVLNEIKRPTHDGPRWNRGTTNKARE